MKVKLNSNSAFLLILFNFHLEFELVSICSLFRCGLRLVQGGPLAQLSVVRVPGKGRGLVTTSPLMAGQFVCEYAGEVIGESGPLIG